MKRSRNTADMILIITVATQGTNAQIGNILSSGLRQNLL